MLNEVNQDLETINEQLDTSLSLDAAKIDIGTTPMRLKFLYKKIGWWKYGLEESADKQSPQIDRMACCLQNEEGAYLVSPDGLESFKTALNQLCNENTISSQTIRNALTRGYSKMVDLLDEIRKKTENPEPHLYKKLWDDFFREYCSQSYDDCKKNFNDWKKKSIGRPSLDELKAKQKKEILKLLKTKFFRFCPNPSGGAIKKRKLKIDEDDLEVGTELPEGFDVECTKFEKFIEWKGGCILSLNYEKLGQYIYLYYHKLEGHEPYSITYFDIMMDFIHEEMAKIKPDLKQYLKRYQEHQFEELLNDCKKIFEPFKKYLKDDIRQTIIDEYLEKLLFDSDLKEEAREMLRGQSKNKYCCAIVTALSSCYIFKPEHNNTANYAKALHKVLSSVTKETLTRYFNAPENNNKALNRWTENIMKDLKTTPNSRTDAG